MAAVLIPSGAASFAAAGSLPHPSGRVSTDGSDSGFVAAIEADPFGPRSVLAAYTQGVRLCVLPGR